MKPTSPEETVALKARAAKLALEIATKCADRRGQNDREPPCMNCLEAGILDVLKEHDAAKDELIYQLKARVRAHDLDLQIAVEAAEEAKDKRIAELEARLNTPEIVSFASAVVSEAAHQRERWGSDHDDGKTDADWFWLIGYLAGKALHNPPTPDGRTAETLRLHRIITVAAAACNWHAATLGLTNMRPGIETPALLAEPAARSEDKPEEHMPCHDSAGVCRSLVGWDWHSGPVCIECDQPWPCKAEDKARGGGR